LQYPATRALVLQAIEEQKRTSRTRNSIANMGMKTNLNLKRQGSESSRMDGLADTPVYKEVAMANTFNKIKPNLFAAAMEVYERV
jgi:hypothetical protein